MSIPYPVTFSGAFTDELYILRPDGVVERPNGMICANYEEWLKFEAERYER